MKRLNVILTKKAEAKLALIDSPKLTPICVVTLRCAEGSSTTLRPRQTVTAGLPSLEDATPSWSPTTPTSHSATCCRFSPTSCSTPSTPPTPPEQGWVQKHRSLHSCRTGMWQTVLWFWDVWRYDFSGCVPPVLMCLCAADCSAAVSQLAEGPVGLWPAGRDKSRCSPPPRHCAAWHRQRRGQGFQDPQKLWVRECSYSLLIGWSHCSPFFDIWIMDHSKRSWAPCLFFLKTTH